MIGVGVRAYGLVLWKKDVGAVEEEESYKFIGVGVRAYGLRKNLLVGVNCIVESG